MRFTGVLCTCGKWVLLAMFKLDGLSVSGFKSFVDPVRLDFAGNMTGIVGPNGCGKSNVCDAVCWVLGERRYRVARPV